MHFKYDAMDLLNKMSQFKKLLKITSKRLKISIRPFIFDSVLFVAKATRHVLCKTVYV